MFVYKFLNTFFIEHFWATVSVTHANDEDDTLIILHAKNSDGDSKPTVFSPDTDVFLPLLQIDPLIFESTKFITGKEVVHRKINISKVYSKSLLVLSALTRTDTAIEFEGRTKNQVSKHFYL